MLMYQHISLSGTHCTGKTTLLNILQYDLFVASTFHFCGSPTRKALQERGLHINDAEDNYDLTQEFCLSYDLQMIQKTLHKNAIFDRSILDTYVYTKYLFQEGKVSRGCFEHIEDSWQKQQQHFTHFCILDPKDLVLVDDGVRSTSDPFREGVHRIVLETLERDIERSRWSLISGTVQERTSQLIKIIERSI